MLIGTAADEVLTEWVVLDDKYWPKWSKDDYIEACRLEGIEVKTSDTIAKLIEKLNANWYVFPPEKISIPDGDMNKIRRIIARAHKFQYSGEQTFDEYTDECQKQLILTDEKMKLKWKLDYYNPKKNRITDLKTTGNLDKVLWELIYKWKLNINHRYVRQGAFYRHLVSVQTGTMAEFELAIIDHNGRHIVLRFSQRALDMAWEQILKDLNKLAELNSVKEFAVMLDAPIDEELWEVLTHTTDALDEEVEDEEDVTVEYV